VTWRYVDGYAVGSSHVASRTPCQDRCAGSLVRSKDGGEVFVAVVSDGAGSALHAEAGAEFACASLLASATEDVEESSDFDRIGDERVRTWFMAVRAALLARARDADAEVRDFAATAMIAMASETQALCAAIGDGAIVVRRAAGEPFEVALWPEAGEYANQTFFVTDETAPERIAIRRYDAVCDVVAFSDGLANLALERATKTAFGRFFEPLVATVRASDAGRDLQAELVAYLNSPAIVARTDDDKALVVGCRVGD